MITVKDLLQIEALSELTLLAGRGGLGREIRAVSVMDAPDSYKWLTGGEVILSSGYLFGDNIWLLEHFINCLTEAGASGLGIKKGRFISKIPDSVIKIADKNKFPIFEIPYTFGWSVIIYAFYDLSIKTGNISEGLEQNAEAAGEKYRYGRQGDDTELIYRGFIDELQNNTEAGEYARRIEGIRGKDTVVYTGVIVVGADNVINVYRLLIKALKSRRIEQKGRVSCHIADNSGGKDRKPAADAVILLEFYPKNDESKDKWQFMFLEEAEYFMQETDGAYIGMGSLYRELSDAAKSYGEALDSLKIGRVLWQEKRCFLYALVSVYSVMTNADPSRVNLSYIRALDNNQTDFSFDGIETIEAYIECGGYKKAAAKLFIHENTMRYRIQKIADYLHLDMDDAIICNILMTQIKLWKLSLVINN